MNTPIQGSVEGGNICCVVELPDPWPPPREGIFSEHRLVGGLARLGGTAEGRLFVEIVREVAREGDVVGIESVPLRVPGGTPVVLIAGWSPDEIFICCNGVLVGSTKNTPEVPAEYVLPEPNAGHTPLTQGQYDDFSADSTKVQVTRRGRHTGRQPVPHRIPGVAADMFAALRDEILQISELAPAIRAGKLHHLRGLASRLRLLVAEGTPQPLLQSCAGYLDVPLPVHTTRFPKEELPVPVISGLSLNLSYLAAPSMNNPLDLDCWLDVRAVNLGQKQFSNRAILKHAGNTIGSHFDHDMLPTMAMLRSTDVGNAEIRYDLLVEFIVKVAEQILPLCEEVYRIYETMPPPSPKPALS